MTTPKPFMKKLTQEEKDEIIDKAMEAFDRDDDDEYTRLCAMLPIPADMLDDVKRRHGMGLIVASGFNVIKAVEKYGEEWLNE
jgi:hypothetical protein